MPIIQFLVANARLLAAGFLLTLASCFGQTYFIAIFAEGWRSEFGLTHGQFGMIFMTATLASAACLIQLGRLADTVAARQLTAGIVTGFALICASVAFVSSWFLLFLAIFGLRLFGQGLMTHLSQTLMARWFNNTRGRALAIASFGHSASEAFAPLAAVALIAALGWRETWGIAAVTLVLVFMPVFWWLLARERTPREMESSGNTGTPGLDGRHWTRAEVIRQPLFWALMPGIISPAFIMTVMFFLPAHIAESKGWAFGTMPSWYWVFALTAVAAAFLSGAMIDRFSARACLPLYQLPMASGLIVLWAAPAPEMAPVALALMGLTAGSSATINSALWAEYYGTHHIGTIKALSHAMMVFSSAIGPGFAGAVIDLGAPFPQQALWYAAYAAAVCLFFLLIVLRRTPRPVPGTC